MEVCGLWWLWLVVCGVSCLCLSLSCVILYDTLYNRARNKRTRIHARAREGLEMPCVALWGVLWAFWECLRVVIAAKT